jgi:hypothetical protein
MYDGSLLHLIFLLLIVDIVATRVVDEISLLKIPHTLNKTGKINFEEFQKFYDSVLTTRRSVM